MNSHAQRYRSSNSGYRIDSNNGYGMRDVKNYELAVGRLATMIDVERTPYAMILFAVVEQAVADIAMVSAPAEFEDQEFPFNICEAAGFLMGHRGSLFMDALGIDRQIARAVLQRYLASELDRASKWEGLTGAYYRVQQALCRTRTQSAKEIAASAGVNHTYASAVLNQLVKRGGVEKVRIKAMRGNGVKYGYALKEAA